MNVSRFTATMTGLGLLCVSSLVLARGPVEHLTDRLDLSEQQIESISVLFDEHRDYMQNEIQWRDAEGNPNPQARDQARAARDAVHQEILTILDEEQAEVFTRMLERRERHGRGKHRGPGFMRALGQLELSEDQEAALRTLMAERKAERMHDREQFRSDLESILSDEQLAQLAAMRENRRGKHRGR